MINDSSKICPHKMMTKFELEDQKMSPAGRQLKTNCKIIGGGIETVWFLL
jgi:hypothetical protein